MKIEINGLGVFVEVYKRKEEMDELQTLKEVVTTYRSVPAQTDATPFYTSTGEHVCKDGVAVSQDLLLSGKIKYGDWVYIEGVGLKKVNDTMHPRMKRHFDVWVATYQEEKEFDQQYGHKKLRVWLVKGMKAESNVN